MTLPATAPPAAPSVEALVAAWLESPSTSSAEPELRQPFWSSPSGLGTTAFVVVLLLGAVLMILPAKHADAPPVVPARQVQQVVPLAQQPRATPVVIRYPTVVQVPAPAPAPTRAAPRQLLKKKSHSR